MGGRWVPPGTGIDYSSEAGMTVLELNAYHGDASVAIVTDGPLAAAIEEERINRKKHCAAFPALAAKVVLDQVGLDPDAIEHVGITTVPLRSAGRRSRREHRQGSWCRSRAGKRDRCERLLHADLPQGRAPRVTSRERTLRFAI